MSSMRILALLAAASTTAWGQFRSLATTYDGASAYFTTTLRLKNAIEQPWGKVFAADERGVRVVVSRELRTPTPPYPTACVVGRLYNFTAVELSADGATLAAPGFRYASSSCRGYQWVTLLRSASGSREVSGWLRLSANGRWAVVDTTTSAFSQTTVAILDLTTGAKTDLQLPAPAGVRFPSGRAIADDGTVMLMLGGRGYTLKPGSTTPQQLPYNYLLAISVTGTRLLYQTDTVHLVDLPSGRDESLSASQSTVIPGTGLSDDGSRAIFIQNQQLYVADFGGGGARQAASVPDGVVSTALSGNGRVAYAVTATGRLVKVLVDTGETAEIVGRTPEATFGGGLVDAGLFTTITGSGFADQQYTAAAPLPLTLGGVSVTVDGRPVPVSRVTPTAIDALIPWDTPPGTKTIVVNAPAVHSPFERPDTTVIVQSEPRAGALYHENWSPLSDLTVHAGETIHVYAVGLGAVTPEVAPGAESPGSEPLPRLASPMSCFNSEVLYAGLAPYMLTRVYQVNLKIGTATGRQVIQCMTGGLSFPFLTLYVQP